LTLVEHVPLSTSSSKECPIMKPTYTSLEAMYAAQAAEEAEADYEQKTLESGDDLNEINRIYQKRQDDRTRTLGQRTIDHDDYVKSVDRINAKNGGRQ